MQSPLCENLGVDFAVDSAWLLAWLLTLLQTASSLCALLCSGSLGMMPSSLEATQNFWMLMMFFIHTTRKVSRRVLQSMYHVAGLLPAHAAHRTSCRSQQSRLVCRPRFSQKVLLLLHLAGLAQGPQGPKGDKGNKGDKGDKGDLAHAQTACACVRSWTCLVTMANPFLSPSMG